MATVPGPNPDQPLPRPDAPAQEPLREPEHDPDEQRRAAPGPDSRPEWSDEPVPWNPERERVEQDVPAGVP
jgi:hypothetical protein